MTDDRKPRIRVPATPRVVDGRRVWGGTAGPLASTSIGRFERARRASSVTADAFQNFSLNLGLGTNNALSDSTYGFLPISRDRTLLEWIHRGSWIAGVAVDAIADDMTREGVKLTMDLDPDSQGDIELEATRLGIWPGIDEVIKWGRLYGGALGLLMIDGQNLATPLDVARVGRDSFRGIMVFDRWMVEPDMTHMVRPEGESVLLPEFYFLVSSGTGVSFHGTRVHHSRCFRHEGVRLPYWQRLMENMWGISVLERLYDRLVAFDSATNGAAQLVYKSYLRTFSVERLREVVALGGQALANLQSYVSLMTRYQGIEGITLIDAADKFEGQGGGTGSFRGVAEALIHFGEQISGALQIPLVRLFGQSPAGLNSTGESDLRTYYDGILQRQEKELRGIVTLIYRVIMRSLGMDDAGLDFFFRPLWQMKETDKVAAAAGVTSTVLDAEERGVVTRGVALAELKQSSELTGVWTNITREMVEAASAEPALPAAPGPEAEVDSGDGDGIASVHMVRPRGRPVHVHLARDAGRLRTVAGLPVYVETAAGERRRADWPPMPCDYGYVRLTGSAEGPGEGLDVFLGPEAENSDTVWVINQVDPETGAFDEHKAMLGFGSRAAAVAAYAASYGDGAAARIGSVRAMPVGEFKGWLMAGDVREAA